MKTALELAKVIATEHSDPTQPGSGFSRRDFLRTGSTALVGASVLGSLTVERSAHAAGGTDLLKIALVGCGGRGRGAAKQALSTAGPTKLVAMVDVQPEKMEEGLNALKDALKERYADHVDVPPERQFSDFDGYKKAIELADVVILATSPGFRPIHFEEAVRQGKHVFMEKPVATDAPGIRRVLAATEESRKKNLKVGVGLQRRHHPAYLEALKRLQDGAIGDFLHLRAYWDGNSRDGVERREGESEMHYQIRNWYYFTWLSGDHIVEQHVHNIDVCNWIKGAHPVRAQGMGGRQVRNAKRHGQIFDHHFVEFEYADGVRMVSQCRQIRGCWPSVSEHVTGAKGTADLADGKMYAIRGANPWRFDTKQHKADPYQLEHDDLFAAIRNDKPYNEAEAGATATMTGILGRMCTYSGQQIEWDDAIASKIELLPKAFAWDAATPVVPDADGWYPVAMPGTTVCV